MAVVAAPKRAMSDNTETWPINVAIASNTNTPYTYRCYKKRIRCLKFSSNFVRKATKVKYERSNSFQF